MNILEIMMYLGISYRELMESPAWIMQLASIRMNEEAEFKKYIQNKK